MDETQEQILDEYLDGRLQGAELAALEARLGEPQLAQRLAERRALRALLSEGAAQLSEADSRRLWIGIQARIAAAPAPGARQPWTAIFTRSWMPAWGLGLGAAAAAVALVLVIQPKPQALPQAEAEKSVVAVQEQAAPASEAKVNAAPVARRAAAPAAMAKAKEEAALPTAMASGPTEVERALAESDVQVDRMIEGFLRQSAQTQAQAPTRMSALSSQGGALVAFNSNELSQDSAGAGSSLGKIGPDGFWDWRPAAMAMNQRDWSAALAELESARLQAKGPSERAFASSALTLLSAPGAPLAGEVSGLPESDDLRVLGAGRWQLRVDERLARYSQGVSARLPGFRTQGNELVLDLTFDRASFASGTRFTRVADPRPARVVNAAMESVDADEFSAPRGAVYNADEKELRLR